MENLVHYLKESFAISLTLGELPASATPPLPLYLKSSYRFFEGKLAYHRLLFIEPVQGLELTPDQKQKQAQVLKELFKLPIIFILTYLEPWERKRLIRKNIAFVQPGKQLYIPEILLDLRDVKASAGRPAVSAAELSFRAQLAILYHLEVKSIENIPLQEIAKELNYSAMNISRIVKELQDYQLIKLEGSKEKHIVIHQKDRKKLWLEVLPLMRSPVRSTWFSDESPADEPGFFISHDTALSRYSILNEGKRTSYSIGRDLFRNLTANKRLQLDVQYGQIRLEVWHYNPSLLSRTNVVDPLSLYLSMRNEDDERVSMALDEMINNIKW